MISLGVDQATNKTGMVLLGSGSNRPKMLGYYLFKTKASMTAYEKQVFMMEKLESVLVEWKPDQIVLEGYGMNLKNPSAIIPLVELGGLLKFMLRARGIGFIAPEPAKWKQFLLGPKKGAAKKEVIAAHILDVFGEAFSTDDLSDAYALAYLGLAFRGEVKGLTSFQREKLGEVKLQ